MPLIIFWHEKETYQTFHSFHVELRFFSVLQGKGRFELGNHHYVSLQRCTWSSLHRSSLFMSIPTESSNSARHFGIPIPQRYDLNGKHPAKSVVMYSTICQRVSNIIAAWLRSIFVGTEMSENQQDDCFVSGLYRFFGSNLGELSIFARVFSTAIGRICPTVEFPPWQLALKEEDHDQDLIPMDWPGVIATPQGIRGYYRPYEKKLGFDS